MGIGAESELCRRPLFRCRRRPRKAVRVSQQQARHVDDLLRVSAKMRNAIEDRRGAGHLEALDAMSFGELPGIDTTEHLLRILYDHFEVAH